MSIPPQPAPADAPWVDELQILTREIMATPEVEPPNAPSREEAMRIVASFPYWYQRIYVGNGIYTHPAGGPLLHELVWRRLSAAVPQDLRGASVLDVGSNAGYFSIQMKRRNAGRVLGLEPLDEYLRQAKWCRDVWGLDIEYQQVNAEDLDRIAGQQFDLVVFTGILYHLKHPLLALERVGRLCRDAVLIETEVLAERPGNLVYARTGAGEALAVAPCTQGMAKFIERDELNGDPSNWWVPDLECVLAMLRTSGFTHMSNPVYLQETRLALVASKSADSLLRLGDIRARVGATGSELRTQ